MPAVVDAAAYRALAAESEWEATLTEMCKMLCILRVHHLNSKGTQPGWPDDVFIGRSVLYAEIKTTHGRVTPAQELMHEVMRAAGLQVVVWRPDDFADGTVGRALTDISPLPGQRAAIRRLTRLGSQRAAVDRLTRQTPRGGGRR